MPLLPCVAISSLLLGDDHVGDVERVLVLLVEHDLAAAYP
jgi:hypothetical protein